MEELLIELKQNHGTIFMANCNGQLFVFRQLTPKEMEEINYYYGKDEYAVQEAVCYRAVVYPEEYDFSNRGLAGVPHALFGKIMKESHFQDANTSVAVLEHHRAIVQNSFHEQAKVFISQAFNTITFEEMDTWTIEKLMNYLARAEWALREIHQLPVRFQETKSEETEGEGTAEEESTLMEVGEEMREEGIDPMIALQPQIKQERAKDGRKMYVQFPMIGGSKLLENKGVLERVRKQIQRVSQ